VRPPSYILPAYYGSPAWHPGGTWIAANHGDSLDADGDGRYDEYFGGIWLVHAETGTTQPLVRRFGYPAWSPDGIHLAMGAGGHIFTIEVTSLDPAQVDTNTLRQLTNEGANFFPAWSPNGQWIAYDNTNCGGPNKPAPPNSCGILAIKSDGSNKKYIVGGRYPDWSPGGSYLTYVGFHGEIYRVNINDTTEVMRLTFLNQVDIYATENLHPKYLPDGTRIAFQYGPAGTYPAIWIMNTDGSQLKELIQGPARAPSWSPDGKQIVFVRHHLYDPIPGNGHLWLFDIASLKMRQLTSSK